MKPQFISRFIQAVMVPPVTAETLAAYYASATDGELQRLDPAQLSSLARPLWQAEMDKRAKARRKDLRSA